MLLLSLVLFLAPAARSQQTLFPGAVPLAVRSPYLNCWNPIQNSSTFGRFWPTTYDINGLLGWTLFARIDGLTYSLLGADLGVNGTANLTDIVITPTGTLVVAEAAHMQVNLTFLSPIESDWVKQSIPFSYLSFTAKSLDGNAHAVQVYSDISGEWTSGNRSLLIKWSATNYSNVIYHSVKLQTQEVFNEISGQAEWGTLYYAMEMGNGVTYKIAADTDSRPYFIANGTLDNQVDTIFRVIDDSFPIFAISRDLGSIQATQAPVVWTIGLTTDPAISYTDLSGAPPSQRSLFYKSQYSDDGFLIVDFLKNFTNASSTAQQLDQKILQDAASVHNLLGDLVSLALPQVYGNMELTIGTDANGNFNESDVMMFMKNLGGVNENRVNAVETLYAAFPALMYIDPSLGALLLEPLFRLQASPNYSIPFAAADLGSNYPNVTGTNSSHNQGVEQTGNMLIMTYAQARASGDGSLISRYYRLLSRWADYLTNNTLFIHDQSSADNLSVTNQTNLAIKGIIAIEAMSKMSSIVQQSADSERYSDAAAQLYGQWKSLALSDDHLLVAYGQANSWTLGYNLFADVWLGTNLVESSVYNGQSSFIDNSATTSTSNSFGMPTDNTDTSIAVSSWNLFVAAMTQDQDLQSRLISNVHKRASLNITFDVFPPTYDPIHGTTLPGAGSPAQGAMFAPLALKFVQK
ncbi:DUF1793-domain-containing protein [Russula dissimulans]|nr:DUF1793-domain-containing protein [Russula dissimulans]